MIETEKPYLIIGAGMSGLLAALLVKKRRPEARVVVIDQASHAGGEYRGVALDGFGYCDRAMRVIYDTGFPEFDELLHGLLPEDEWHVLPDNRKDVVGLYWRGQLQTNCQYPDLRRLPEATRRLCEEEILRRAGNDGQPQTFSNAEQFFTTRFGPTAASYWDRVLQKLYRAPARDLHLNATRHPAMNRVVLYDEARMPPVLANDRLRPVIAWPEQLTFPLKRRPAQCGLYPRRFGMTGVIDAAVQQLRARGVRILFNRRVAALEQNDGAVAAVRLDDGEVFARPALVVGANGLPASLRLLWSDSALPATPAPPRNWMVFLRSAEPPAMNGLYHFFCYDDAYQTFRVTNYAGYCPAAQTDAGFPLCVELWSEDATPAEATTRALAELQAMNMLDERHITARAALASPNYHAMCSLTHVRHLNEMRSEIATRAPRNFLAVGPFMDDGAMLLFEVWRAMYPLLAQRL